MEIRLVYDIDKSPSKQIRQLLEEINRSEISSMLDYNEVNYTDMPNGLQQEIKA